jgi:hypothetical protein
MKPKCYIAGCIRNNAKYIPYFMTNIISLIGEMEDYMLLFAYDESTDDTLPLLEQYKTHRFGEKIEIFINKEPLSENRSQNICNARNWIHNRIEELNVDRKWDYMIFFDCDEICSYPILLQNIMPYFERNDWDCLSFNRRDYYDIWALAFDHYVVPCWSWKNASRHVIAKMMKTIMGKLYKIDKTELLECHSAFNGFAIYRIKKFKDCVYEWKMPALSTYDMDSIQKCMQEFNCPMPHDIEIEGERDDCEHRSFHLAGREKNGAKIRISPLYAFIEPPPRINPPWIAYYRGQL